MLATYCGLIFPFQSVSASPNGDDLQGAFAPLQALNKLGAVEARPFHVRLSTFHHHQVVGNAYWVTRSSPWRVANLLSRLATLLLEAPGGSASSNTSDTSCRALPPAALPAHNLQRTWNRFDETISSI